MRNMRWVSWLGAVAATVVLVGAGPAAAVSSDRAAAIVNFPLIVVGGFAEKADEQATQSQIAVGNVETLVQLGNVSDVAVNAHCFYENANAHCTNTGDICTPLFPVRALDCGTCVPGCSERN